jgi:hypothetical protein
MLLGAIFDLLRNGLAHLSQQIPAHLSDDKIFVLTLAGAEGSGPP